MAKINIHLAKPENNQKIIDFCNNQKMAGSTQIILERSPDFFKAMKVEGTKNNIVWATTETTHEVALVGTASEKPCYVNGQLQDVGYLGNLRVAPEFQKGMTLPRSYKFFRKIHNEEMSAKLYLTTIINENEKAKKVLTSNKGGIPPYKSWGNIRSYVFASYHMPWKNNLSSEYSFRAATKEDLEELAQFYENYSKTRQFYPKYTKDDIEGKDGLLLGNTIDNYTLCIKNQKIVGSLSFWDQSAFRRWKVQSYSKALTLTRSLVNMAARIMGLPKYPPIHSFVPYKNLSCVAIENDNPEILEAMLAYKWAELKPHDLVIGLCHETDPFSNIYNKAKSIRFDSELYVVYWDEEGEKQYNKLSKELIPYIETGSI